MRASRRLGLTSLLVAGCFNPSGGGSTTASSATTGDGSTTATAPTTGPGVPTTTGETTTTGEPGTTGDSTGAPLSSSSETTAQSTSGSTSGTSGTSGTSETTAVADTGTTAPDETTSGTTGLELTCGDGFLLEDEECDDSNQVPGDGCNATRDREVLLIFATSMPISGSFGGVAKADAMCQALAGAVPVPPIKGRRVDKFVAYLSAPGADASSRLKTGDLGYARPKDLATVAKTYGDLIAGNFQIPVLYDELGVQIPGNSSCNNMLALVWTGTEPGGMTAEDHCGNWMDPLLIGKQGSALSSGTPAIAACGFSCLASSRLYCVENP